MVNYYSQLSLRQTPLGPVLCNVSALERSPSYRESNKGSKEKQGPRCPFYRGVHQEMVDCTIINSFYFLWEF